MTRTAILTLALAALASLPAAAQNRYRRPANQAASYGTTGNPAQYYNQNGTYVYAPYNGYAPAAPSGFNPYADPFYNAAASCDSPVMQQNGWTPVRQTAENQCEWQKPKTDNPQYVEWLRRYEAQQAALQRQREQAYRASQVRSDPVTKMSPMPGVTPAPAPVPQPTLQQRLGTPGWMPLPNVPAQAVPNWYPSWGAYQQGTQVGTNGPSAVRVYRAR